MGPHDWNADLRDYDLIFFELLVAIYHNIEYLPYKNGACWVYLRGINPGVVG